MFDCCPARAFGVRRLYGQLIVWASCFSPLALCVRERDDDDDDDDGECLRRNLFV